MNSIKTKTKNYVTAWGKCVTQVVAVAEERGFRIYVAWEWKDMAEKGIFGFLKSQNTYYDVTRDSIDEAASFGLDISGTAEAKEVFGNIL